MLKFYFQLKDALKLYEEEMLKENKMKPSPYTFSVLINGCAAVGYTKEAFSLFKKVILPRSGLKLAGARRHVDFLLGT